MSMERPPRIIEVLLVEDSAAVALQIENYLSEAKGTRFVLEHVRDLTSARERMVTGGIDLILLDLGLPDSHGLGTFYRMHDLAPDLPMVVFTGVSDEDLALEALRQGAQDYLVKGQVDGALLIRAIRYAIERKQAEETLRENEEKHRTLLEAMPDIVYKIDPDGYIKYMNPAVTRLGYEPEEVIGQHFSVLVHPEDVDQVSRSSLLPVFAGKITGTTGAPKLLDERRSGDRLTKDLVLRLVPREWNENDDTHLIIGSLTSYGEVTATGHYHTNRRTKEKKFAGTVGIIKDITERMRAEAEKAALQDQLMQAQKMEAIGRLAGGVAHDMNNVLGAILGSASVLDVEVEQSDHKREDIENILIACRKGRSLTRDLLGFARKGKYVNETISLNEVAEEAKALLKRTIAKTIDVNTALDGELRNIEGDRSQVHHALMNVCINAADSMDGQGTIEISTKNVTLEMSECMALGGLSPGDYVQLGVRDTGAGMDQDTIKKVFEPFFTTKPKGEGTGLGLSMVYGVIKNHGGSVTLESDQGKGTTVTFFLPILEKAKEILEEPPDKSVSSQPDRGGILFVDDEKIIRSSARRLLEKLGYSVFLAEGGQSALEVYKQEGDKISLVLLDLIMPEMDGSETFEGLTAISPDVKVLLLSGYSKDEKIETLLRKGAIGFLQKPFDLRALSDVVKKALK